MSIHIYHGKGAKWTFNLFHYVSQTLDQREKKTVEDTEQCTQTSPPRSLVRCLCVCLWLMFMCCHGQSNSVFFLLAHIYHLISVSVCLG